MSRGTGISWTDETWNPLVGCSRVSEGCRNCYAERVAATRMRGNPDYVGIARVNADGEPRWTGTVKLIEKRLDQPMRWRRPRMIFVNSMSDLFHESVPFETIAAIFGVMATAEQHTFQVLTKRPERMREFFDWIGSSFPALVCAIKARRVVKHASIERTPRDEWPLPHVWLGTSVEDQATANERIPMLLRTPAAVRWISAEPLLGPVDLNWIHTPDGDTLRPLHELGWVVAGGESGPDARPMHPNWVRRMRSDCNVAGVPFHLKQLGEWVAEVDHPDKITAKAAETAVYLNPDTGEVRDARYGARGHDTTMQRVGRHRAGRELDGVVHDAWPVVGEVGA